MKRSTRAGVEGRWHRGPRPGENVSTWCPDKGHSRPGTLVPTVRHGQGRRWLARWVDDDGSERSKAFDRKADAQNHITGVLGAMSTGTYTDPKRSAVTFATVAQMWLDSKTAGLKPSTLGGYRSVLGTLALPRWGEVALRDITHAELQAWVNTLSSDPDARQRKSSNADVKGLSASRIIHAYRLIHQILKFAVRARYVATNVAADIQLPRTPAPEKTALTHAQVRQLAEAAGVLGTQVYTLAYAGLRYGEAAALKVGDVDVRRRRLRVSRSVTAVNGRGMVETMPKTHQSRTVPVPQLVADALAEQIKGRASSDLVFPSPDYGWMSIDWFRVRFDKACAAAGLTGITPHTLRHTAGSLGLALPGTTVVTVQRLLGHKSAITTRNVYAHQLPEDFDNLTAALDAAAARAAV